MKIINSLPEGVRGPIRWEDLSLTVLDHPASNRLDAQRLEEGEGTPAGSPLPSSRLPSPSVWPFGVTLHAGTLAPDDVVGHADTSEDTQGGTWSEAEVTGRRLGQYIIYEEIARGGMASVHLGRTLDPERPRPVAIKRLDARLARNPNFVAMFVDEGRMAARINHPNVVPPIDMVFRASEGDIYLVMEYVHGETLAHILSWSLRQGEYPSSRVSVGIMDGVLRGLQAAHEATTREGAPMGIVHRDVSPQNIMLGADGVTRLVDFGVAKAAAVHELSHDDRKLRFKLAYAAPEQIRGQEVDRRADVFSAGVVLWEMLTGRRLFAGGDRALVMGHLPGKEIPPPSSFGAEISPALDAIVLRALQRDRRLRFASALDFNDALKAVIEPASNREVGEWVKHVCGDWLARRADRVARIMSGERSRSGGQTPVPAAPPRTDRPIRSRKWKRLAAAGVLIGALACVALWSTSGSAGQRRQSSPTLQSAQVPAAPDQKALDEAPDRKLPATVTAAPPVEAQAEVDVAAAPPRVEVSVALPEVAAAAPEKASEKSIEKASENTEEKTDEKTEAKADEKTEAKADEKTEAKADEKTTEQEGNSPAPLASETQPVAAPTPPSPSAEPKHLAHTGRDRATQTTRKGPEAARATAVLNVATLNRMAYQAYRRLDMGSAQKLLRTALVTAAHKGLAGHRITAQSHALLGVVLVNGYKQSQLGVEQFRRALRIDPMVPMSGKLAQPEAAAAFRQAVASLRSSG